MLRGGLTLHGQARPVTVDVILKDAAVTPGEGHGETD